MCIKFASKIVFVCPIEKFHKWFYFSKKKISSELTHDFFHVFTNFTPLNQDAIKQEIPEQFCALEPQVPARA